MKDKVNIPARPFLKPAFEEWKNKELQRWTLARFNEWLADRMAGALSTMLMFYGITVLVLSILLFQAPRTPLEWVQYVVQTLFQGVALPVLAFVSKNTGQRQEKLLQETHDAVMAEMKEIKEVLVKMGRIEKEIEEIESDLNEE